MSSPQGANWPISQCSNLRHLQSGLVAGRSAASYSCQSGLGVASISKIFSGFGGGDGKGFGGWGRGGGGGGDGVPAAGEGSIGAPGGDASNPITEDVIFLSVGGMSCGGCCKSVKRILEAQPQVKEATVDLATETAVVQVTTEPVTATGWEVVKRELGEQLAKHLTSCGFKSSLKEDGDKAALAA